MSAPAPIPGGAGEIARTPGGTFAPGTSGNPGGRPKAVKEVVELARKHTTEAIETLREIATDPKTQAMARVKACELLLARGWGQPSPEVDLDRRELGEQHLTFTFMLAPPAGPPPPVAEFEGELVGESDSA